MLYKKAVTSLFALCFLGLFAAPMGAGYLDEYLDEIPGIGLIADEINFEGIRLSHLQFVADKEETSGRVISGKYLVSAPGEWYEVDVEYAVDAEVLATLDMHHFIYGLYDDGPQNCFLHSLGIVNKKGKAQFQLQAPENPGVYQLRFCHAIGVGTFDQVKDHWWEPESATGKTTMAIVVVKDHFKQ